MKVTLIDKNIKGTQTIIDALSICRDKQCSPKTIEHCINNKPEPHLSVLEHCWFSFLVEGLSVKANIQLLRHRLQSRTERSTRHINMSEAKFVIPETVKNKAFYKFAYSFYKDFYKEAIKSGESIEDAAYLLPLGVETKFYISGNGRMFFEWLNKRLCKRHVQRESYRLAQEVYKILVKEMFFFKYAHPCRYCNKCREER